MSISTNAFFCKSSSRGKQGLILGSLKSDWNVTPNFMHHLLIEHREMVLGNEGVWKMILARRYKPSASRYRENPFAVHTNAIAFTLSNKRKCDAKCWRGTILLLSI